MKRRVSILLSLVLMFLFGGCSSNESGLKFYTVNPYWIWEEGEEETTNNAMEEFGIPLEGEDLEQANEVFNNLSTEYGIQKEAPNYYFVEEETYVELRDLGGLYGGAFFDENNSIFIRENYETDNPVIAHEVMHYLMNSKDTGYKVNNSARLGIAFEEGCTNYLSTKLYPFDAERSVYEFETFSALLFEIGFGTDFKEVVVNETEWFEILREDFNEAVKEIYSTIEYEGVELTPFDLLMGSLESYQLYVSLVGTEYDYPNSLGLSTMMFSAMDLAEMTTEMLFKYGEAKGIEVKNDMAKALEEFIANENYISWSQFSDLGKMIK